MIMILLGAPGSGKGSISSYLKDNYGFKHISTGDLFRKTLASDTPLARQLKDIMSSGKLVSDDITNQMVKEELSKIDTSKVNLILDGYPRNINQLNYLVNLVKLDYAIDVCVDKEEIVKRITGRRTCPVCKEIYNIYYKKPMVEGKCDKDGSLLVQRADDQESIVIARYKTYIEANQPLVDKARALGIYHTVRNDKFEEAIAQVKKVLNLQ